MLIIYVKSYLLCVNLIKLQGVLELLELACPMVCACLLTLRPGVLSKTLIYIGETSRTLGERYKEHLKDPSSIHQHSNHTGHPTSHNKFQIKGREGHSLARNIKESIFIRVNNPTLNRNIGKFNLPHIWDRVLLNTPGLKVKRHVHTVGHVNSNSSTPPVV